MLSENMHITVLKTNDLAALLELERRVLQCMAHDYFLKHRTRADWMKILAGTDHVVYGVFDGDRLIASATVHFPNGLDGRDIPEFAPVADTELAIFQAVMVDNDYRGRGLMKILQDMRQGAAIRRKRGKIICKISAENLGSWKNAINYGFHCVRVAPDDTGHDKMYFIKKLQLRQTFFAK
jgi:GNAT superfamily N-acetyltransferase